MADGSRGFTLVQIGARLQVSVSSGRQLLGQIDLLQPYGLTTECAQRVSVILLVLSIGADFYDLLQHGNRVIVFPLAEVSINQCNLQLQVLRG
ncbi:hypothetical protein D3C84_912880 [compost metagenome]